MNTIGSKHDPEDHRDHGGRQIDGRGASDSAPDGHNASELMIGGEKGESPIDPFEHLVQSRIKRWRLDQSGYHADLARAVALVRSDPDMALAKCRKILERCMRNVHETCVGPAGTKPLEQINRELTREGMVPRKVSALAEVVRELGNVGAHPIMDEEDLSHREAQIAVLALLLLLEWYSRAIEPPGGRRTDGVPPDAEDFPQE